MFRNCGVFVGPGRVFEEGPKIRGGFSEVDPVLGADRHWEADLVPVQGSESGTRPQMEPSCVKQHQIKRSS